MAVHGTLHVLSEFCHSTALVVGASLQSPGCIGVDACEIKAFLDGKPLSTIGPSVLLLTIHTLHL